MRIHRLWKAAAVAAVGTVVASCGSHGSKAASSSTPGGTGASPSASSPSAPALAPYGSASCQVAVGTDTEHKPTVTVPAGCTPPTTLVSKDVVAGTGPALAAGQTAVVHYDLYTWSKRLEVESSWDTGQPFPVQNVGQAQVIDGWNEGLPGMKKGGRRLLIVPPDKGYGPGGSGPIGPDETLVFVVDVLQITP